jgi:hypothetical protein
MSADPNPSPNPETAAVPFRAEIRQLLNILVHSFTLSERSFYAS